VSEGVVDNLVQDATREALDTSPLTARDGTRKSSPIRVFGEPTKQPSAFEAPKPAAKDNVFTYVNPFEQLSASSPRNRTPKPESRTTTPKPETTKGRDTSQDISSSTSQARKISPELTSSTPEPAASTPPSATIPPRPETVSEALSEVGEQVHKEVAEALAQATSTTHGDSMSGTSELEKAMSETAIEIKEELKIEDTRKETEAGMSKSMTETFETTIETVAEALDVDADSQDPVAKSSGVVRVFNFPMRPFFAIEIKKLDEPPARITTEMMSDISRLKKDFDQIDRNLVVATVNHIVYPLKNGGFRVIRQDTGEHTQVFQNCKERVFNVAVGRNLDKEHEIETVLATGVDGSVFWTSLLNYQGDENYGSEHESRGFILPPMSSGDDNHAGGQLKTRVKASTRHPSFFAYGRGKSIYIIYPSVARSTYFTNDKRICDSEKYLKDRCLKIQTGKAAKDFTFSADDTVVASLDKVGKIKFWDIRTLADSKFDATYQEKYHEAVSNPILMLATHMQDQKMWPTSLMFIDKERPMAKGIALRYLVVGMKQNHTLQLWDLSLQKAVQEINFPHEGESDAICSLAYHPKTGILVVGHPTRNSVYLLHVSSPKYNLSPMAQAKYMNMVASRDKSLPAPDSTIIVSGVREFSLGQKGELRSLDIMDDAAEKYSLNDPPFFDLYVMHSKGITDIAIQREHLGWSKEGKILNPVDAVDTRAISLKPLVQPPQSLPGDDSTTNGTNAQSTSTPAKPGREPSTRTAAARTRELEVAATPATPSVENVTVGEKPDKKKKKKAADVSSPAPALTTPNRSKSPMPHVSIEREAGSLTKATDSDVPAWASQLLAIRKSGGFAVNDDETKTTLAGFEQSMNVQFSNLFRKIADDRRVQEAASTAKQEAVLHLVSSTLSENVEQVMDKIMNEAINKTMLGPFKDILIQNIDRSLTDAFSQSMKASLPREIEKTLPPALRGVMENQALIRHIADRVTTIVQNEVRARLEATYADILAPGFRNLAIQSTKTVADEIERRVTEQLRNAEMQRKNDSAKIDHLVKQVNSLQEVIGTLAQDQSRFQTQLVNYLRQVQHSHPPAAAVTQVTEATSSRAPPMSTPQKTKEEMEVDEISRLLNSRDYESATVKVNKQSCIPNSHGV
jgi:WD40 repeat protein